MGKNISLKWGLGLFLVILLATVYRTYDPTDHFYFPKCPFLVATGYQCPGCGSQRAVHHLLNLELGQAMNENLLLVVSMPYILAGFIINNVKRPTQRLLLWRRRLYGLKAILLVLSLILAFGILRNTPRWPQLF